MWQCQDHWSASDGNPRNWPTYARPVYEKVSHLPLGSCSLHLLAIKSKIFHETEQPMKLSGKHANQHHDTLLATKYQSLQEFKYVLFILFDSTTTEKKQEQRKTPEAWAKALLKTLIVAFFWIDDPGLFFSL